jgi:AraC-like DNA-binding protein
MKQRAPQLLLDQSFEDIGRFGQAVGWDMDFRQLDSGKLEAGITAISGKHVQLIRFNLSRRFHQVGSSQEGMMTFGVLDLSVPDINWCSQWLSGGAMTNFNRNDGFDCVSEAGFIGYALVIEPGVLYRMAANMGMSENFETLLAEPHSWSSPRISALGKHFDAMYRVAVKSGNSLREHAESLDDEIPNAVFEELTCNFSSSLVPSPNAKKKILRKALDIVNDPDEIPITVSRLCDRIGTSASTLNRVFVSEYGVSPKSYIRFRCLSAVRDVLACSSPGTKVTDVANRWGFWHMGQFAADYRAMFRELPSSTLNRP